MKHPDGRIGDRVHQACHPPTSNGGGHVSDHHCGSSASFSEGAAVGATSRTLVAVPVNLFGRLAGTVGRPFDYLQSDGKCTVREDHRRSPRQNWRSEERGPSAAANMQTDFPRNAGHSCGSYPWLRRNWREYGVIHHVGKPNPPP